MTAATPADLCGRQAWRIVTIGDYSRDARSDVLWRNAVTGANVVWRSGNGATQQAITGVSDLAWIAQP